LERTFQPSTKQIEYRPRPSIRNADVDAVLESSPELKLEASFSHSKNASGAPSFELSTLTVPFTNGHLKEAEGDDDDFSSDAAKSESSVPEDLTFHENSEEHQQYSDDDQEAFQPAPSPQPTSQSPSPPPSPLITHKSQSIHVDKKLEQSEIEEIKPPLKRKGPGRPRIHRIKGKKGRIPSKNSDSICDVCGESYSRYVLTAHKWNKHHPHFTPQGHCDICSAGPFKTCAGFVKTHWIPTHSRKADGQSKNYICDECPATFKIKRGLEFHRANKHSETPVSKQCQFCQKIFSNQLSLNGHLNRFHKNEGRFSCLRCEWKAPSQEELKAHVKVEHPSQYFPCETCGVLKYSLGTKLFHYKNCKGPYC